ncbi:MAG: hypothetical protein JWQ02_102 [Capsulimonas sp.]|nr:hypothetical protein [Capsulimonas sp.]
MLENFEAEAQPESPVLVIHHVLPKFEKRENGSVAFDPRYFFYGINSWINRNHVDRIILTKEFPDDLLYPELENIPNICIEEWAWDSCGDNEFRKDIAKRLGLQENDIVEHHAGEPHFSVISPWMKTLIGCQITIMGGFRYECVQALTEAFSSMEINCDEYDDLIYPKTCIED